MVALTGAAATGWCADKVAGLVSSNPDLFLDPAFGQIAAGAVMTPVWDPAGNLFGGIAAGAVILGAMAYWTGREDRALRKEVSGREFGQARWATDAEIAAYAHTSDVRTCRVEVPRSRAARREMLRRDPGTTIRGMLGMDVRVVCPAPDYCERIEDDNIILSRKARLQLSPIPNRLIERNKHVMVIGGSGAGKTFRFVIPMILQDNCFLVFTDPKGDTAEQAVAYERSKGRYARIVNIKPGEFNGARFNPLVYLYGPSSVLAFVDTLIKNTTGNKGQINGNADFFVKAETQLDTALVGWVYYSYRDRPQYCTMGTVIDMLQLAKEGSERGVRGGASALDRIIIGDPGSKGDGTSFRERLIAKYGSEEAAKLGEEWFVITNYRGFKETAGSPETEASVLASCNVRLSPFSIGEVRDFLSRDELRLDRIGTKPGALFLVSDDMSEAFNFLFAILLSTMFSVIARTAAASPGGHCPVPVNCVLDEFANIGEIPGFDTKIATLRSRWVNLMPILQSHDQLEKWYKDTAGIIDGNCDTLLFLGSAKDKKTREYISEQCGKRTIPVKSESVSKGRNGSYQVSWSRQAQPLISPDELLTEPGKFGRDDCIVIINSEHAILDKKYNPKEHPRWPEWERARLSGITTATLRAELDAMGASRVTGDLSLAGRHDEGRATDRVSWSGLIRDKPYELRASLVDASGSVVDATSRGICGTDGSVELGLSFPPEALAAGPIMAREEIWAQGELWASHETDRGSSIALPRIETAPVATGIAASEIGFGEDDGIVASFDLDGLVPTRHYTLEVVGTAADRSAAASRAFRAEAASARVDVPLALDLEGLPGRVQATATASLLPGSVEEDGAGVVRARVWLSNLDGSSSYVLRASLPGTDAKGASMKVDFPPERGEVECEMSFDRGDATEVALGLTLADAPVWGCGHAADPSEAIRVPRDWDGESRLREGRLSLDAGGLHESLELPELRDGESYRVLMEPIALLPDGGVGGPLIDGQTREVSATEDFDHGGAVTVTAPTGCDMRRKRVCTSLTVTRTGTVLATASRALPPAARQGKPGGAA